MATPTTNFLRYHLRFQVLPGKGAQGDAAVLARFCAAHGIEEVVLFLAAEEWNNGLLSREEEDLWFETIKGVKTVLDKAGVITSLNPWMTVLHCDRGRSFPEDRSFKPMVSPTGQASQSCASFADPGWRTYIDQLYGRFAQLDFRVIWIEDDFRYHNHDPLDWGGGFEEEVLHQFADRVGQQVSRTEVVSKVLAPGPPHPWRIKWLELWRDIQLEVAEGLARAVAQNAPGETKLGLMSSLPSMHSGEGREWRRLFDALMLNGQVAHRPHFGGYREAPGRDQDSSIMMLDVQKGFRPPDCEVAPEVENFPFTSWTKSDSMTWSEMGFCMFYGSDALLLDLFPMSGNRADSEPELGALLDNSRPALEWISARFSSSLETCGVGIPWVEDAQAHVRTSKGEDMLEFNASSFGPGHFLLPYGIPVSAGLQEVNAVFGGLAWAFDDEKIRELLSGGLFLDGMSADILCERGFGPYIGVTSKGRVCREEGLYSIERVHSEKTGVAEGHYFNANYLESIYVLEPLEGAQEWTTILTPKRKRFGAGVVVYENQLGGRVATTSAPDPACLPRSFQRQTITQEMVAFLAGGKFSAAMVRGTPYLMPIHFKGQGGEFLVVFNGTPDVAKPSVHMGAVDRPPVEATLLAPLKEPVQAGFDTVNVDGVSGAKTVTVTSRDELAYRGFLVFQW
jgi:hypothetical protein